MSFDPYATLGVARDADDAEIRAAYRARAQSAHPDHGGDVAGMADLNAARALLTDRTRRARFDATGDAESQPIDAVRRRALTTVAQWVEDFLDRDEAQFKMDDPIGDMRATAFMAIDTIGAQQRKLAKQINRTRKMQGRFRGGEGASAIRRMIAQKLALLELGIARAKDDIAHYEEVLVVLKDVTFDVPAEDARGTVRVQPQFSFLEQAVSS